MTVVGRRATTEFSFVIGVDKPVGMTSHDVVARCRRIYSERRIGHTGTLDPLASGVLVICVGPATRLDRFLTSHDKVYEFSIVFGTATDTDDEEGQVISTAAVPAQVADQQFASCIVSALVGVHNQLPPAYCAIKVHGKKSYEAARAGSVPELAPRPIEIYDARLLACRSIGAVVTWTIRAHVSAGTYVRSIARDVGCALGTVAHVGALRRVKTGTVTLDNCVPLDALEFDPFNHLLDPVRLLGFRFLLADEAQVALVSNGRPLDVAGLSLYTYDRQSANPKAGAGGMPDAGGVHVSSAMLTEGEYIAVVNDDTLMAIYEYRNKALRSACGFSKGVKCGSHIYYR